LTFSSLDDIIKSTHAIDAKGGRLPIGIPGRLQIGMHGRLRRYPQKGRHAVTDCAITPADAIGEAFCEERERLGLAKALTTDVGRVGLNCFDYELTCQKVGRKGAPAARRTPWSQKGLSVPVPGTSVLRSRSPMESLVIAGTINRRASAPLFVR